MRDSDKLYECDHCVGLKIANENNSVFVRLPFPVECEGNIFGKPEEKRKPDHSFYRVGQVINWTHNADRTSLLPTYRVGSILEF